MAATDMGRVTLNQHLKINGVMYEPGVPCELPEELVEELEKKGKIQEPKHSAAQAADGAPPAQPAEARISDEQRELILRGAIVKMVQSGEGLGQSGAPNVAELEQVSGVNTDATERNALFAELFPEPSGDQSDGGDSGSGDEKKPSAISRLLGEGS